MAIQRKQLNSKRIICLIIVCVCILSVGYINKYLIKGYYTFIYPTLIIDAQILDKKFRGTSEGDFYDYQVEYSINNRKIKNAMSIWKEADREYSVGETIKIISNVKRPEIAEFASNLNALRWQFISCFIILAFFIYGVIGLFTRNKTKVFD